MFKQAKRHSSFGRIAFALAALGSVGMANAGTTCSGGTVVSISSHYSLSNGFTIVVQGLSGNHYTFATSGTLVGGSYEARARQIYQTALLSLATGLPVTPIVDVCTAGQSTSLIGLSISNG